MTPNGAFHWNELMTRDPEGAKAFYGATLGWTFDAFNAVEGAPTYWVAMMGELPVGGIYGMTGPDFDGVPEHWFSYVGVEDVDATAEKVAAAGGQVVRPAFDIPSVGRIAIIMDTAGASVGLITPAPMG